MCNAFLVTTYQASTAQKLPKFNVIDVPSLIDNDFCSLTAKDTAFGIAT